MLNAKGVLSALLTRGRGWTEPSLCLVGASGSRCASSELFATKATARRLAESIVVVPQSRLQRLPHGTLSPYV